MSVLDSFEQLSAVDLAVIEQRMGVGVGGDEAAPLADALTDLGPGDAVAVDPGCHSPRERTRRRSPRQVALFQT